MVERAYIRDGAEIYRRSFAIIRAESDLARFSPTEERVAVRLKRVLLLRTSVTDMRPYQNQRRPAVFALRLLNRRRYRFRVVAVRYVLRVPAVGVKTLRNIFRKRKVCSACQRNVVLIVKIDQLS